VAAEAARAKRGVTKMQDRATKRVPAGPRAAAMLFIGAEYRKIPVTEDSKYFCGMCAGRTGGLL
jgi:hypothetical protein